MTNAPHHRIAQQKEAQMETVSVDVRFGPTSYKVCTLAGEGTCRHCGAEIVWAITPAGSYSPLNVAEVEPGVMEPHFATCTAKKREERR